MAKKTTTRKSSTKAGRKPAAKANKTRTAAKPKKAIATAKANGVGKRTSAIDAAFTVLKSAKDPMNTREMIEAMASKKLWTSPGGKTPHATLYSAILREIATKGKDARFKKTERGKFSANG
jgi:hypothetical protein